MNNNFITMTTHEWEKILNQSIYLAKKISDGNYESGDPELLLQILETLRDRIGDINSMSGTKNLM